MDLLVEFLRWRRETGKGKKQKRERKQKNERKERAGTTVASQRHTGGKIIRGRGGEGRKNRFR